MKNILHIVFFLFVLFSVGIPDAGQNHKSCSDIYSPISEMREITEEGDTQSDYEDGIDLTSLRSNLLLGSMEVTDTQEHFSHDNICKIFQPPR